MRYRKLAIYAVLFISVSGFVWRFRLIFYPLSTVVLLKVIGYGAIPCVLAWAGDHFAAESLSEPKKKWLSALLGVAVVSVVEKKTEEDHVKEVDEQKAQNGEMAKCQRRETSYLIFRRGYLTSHRQTRVPLIGPKRPSH